MIGRVLGSIFFDSLMVVADAEIVAVRKVVLAGRIVDNRAIDGVIVIVDGTVVGNVTSDRAGETLRYFELNGLDTVSDAVFIKVDILVVSGVYVMFVEWIVAGDNVVVVEVEVVELVIVLDCVVLEKVLPDKLVLSEASVATGFVGEYVVTNDLDWMVVFSGEAVDVVSNVLG